MTVLRAEGVTKVFREGHQLVEVLRGMSLSVDAGEVVGLEGPSGSGKTTFLSILGCILTATSGEVVVDGQVVDANRPELLPALRRRAIGFVFQQFNLFPALSAVENVEYALNVKGKRGAEARQEAERLIEAVGLGDRAAFLPRDLSGGQKQRVAIARALCGSPAAVLADEPTANLDSQVGLAILQLFKELAKRDGRALLIVTHDPHVRSICDRVVRIADGRIVDGSAPHAIARPPYGAPPEVPVLERKLPMIRYRPMRALATMAFVLAVAAAFLTRAFASRSPPSVPSEAPPPRTAASRTIRAEGRLVARPGAQVVIGTEVSGRLASLAIQEKDSVRRGDVIATLTSDEQRAAVDEAKALLTDADVHVVHDETELARMQRLASGGFATQQSLDEAKRKRDGSLARRGAAAAEVQRLAALLAKRRIVAPVDGVVLERHAEAGEMLDAGARVVTMADLTRTRIEAEVDEFDAGAVTLGAPATITAEGLNGNWHGTVEEIPDRVVQRRLKPEDPGRPSDTRVLLVKISLAEPIPVRLGQRVELAIGAM